MSEVKEVKELRVYSKQMTTSIPFRDENNKLQYMQFYNHTAILKTESAQKRFDELIQSQKDNKSPRTLFHFKEWNELVRPESQWIEFPDGSKVAQEEVVAGWEFAKSQGWKHEKNMLMQTGSRAGTVTQGITSSAELPKQDEKKGKKA